MASTEYVALLRDPRWQRKRLEVMRRDDFKCRGCGDRESELQVHHRRYNRDGKPWEVSDSALVTLCHKCHERTTVLRREANDVLCELAPDQLHFAVDLLNQWANHGSNPIQYALACLDASRTATLARPFSPAASRSLEAVDGAQEAIWEALDAATPRSYGEAQ